MMIFKRKRKLPKIHWGDITIAQHKAILALYDKYKDEDDDLMFAYEMVAIAYNKPIEWLNSMKIKEANDYVNSLAILNERPKARVAKSHYILNGHKYKTTMNLQEVSTSQYIDFQQMADKSREMPAEFLSIILVPAGKEYGEGYDISQVVHDIENYMSVEDCLGLSAFFFDLFLISMKQSLRTLKKLEAKARKEGKMSNEQLEALSKVRELLECVNGLKR